MFDKINLTNNPIVRNHQANSQQQNVLNNDFKSIFKNALNKVSQVEHEANYQQQLLIEGKSDDLHNVMIAAQKATLTIETAVQIQQKVIDTYNEVMRMQI